MHLHFLLLPFLYISLHFSNTFSWFGLEERHLILNWVYEIRWNHGQQKSLVRKRKWRSLTCKGSNGLIWKHLKRENGIAVPPGINLVKFDRTKQDHVFKRERSPPKKQQTYRKCFQAARNVPGCSFEKEPTTEVVLERRVKCLLAPIGMLPTAAAHELGN